MNAFGNEEPSKRVPESGMVDSGGAVDLPKAQMPMNSGQIESWSRLDHLYRISTLITGFEVLENPLEAVLGMIANTLPIRSAIVIDGSEYGHPQMRSWTSKDVSSEDFTAAVKNAQGLNEYFLTDCSGPKVVIRPHMNERYFVVIPLVVDHHPAFGVFQLECTAQVDEADVTFVGAVANQLAVAIDRNNTRKREAITIRKLREFTAIAAHDLKSPLHSIINFSQVIQEGRKPERHADYLSRIIRAAERMDRLIVNLLDQSRLESEKIKLSTIDVARMANEVWRDLENITEKKNAEIEVESMPAIIAGRYQVRQLLHNLIGNALKYSKNDVAPVIRVSGRLITSGGQRFVEISIVDNGIGFDPVFLDKIFELFGRLHTSRDYEGSGLGLPICRKIVDRHGGTITARSAVGEGSTFIFTLPAAKTGDSTAEVAIS